MRRQTTLRMLVSIFFLSLRKKKGSNSCFESVCSLGRTLRCSSTTHTRISDMTFMLKKLLELGKIIQISSRPFRAHRRYTRGERQRLPQTHAADLLVRCNFGLLDGTQNKGFTTSRTALESLLTARCRHRSSANLKAVAIPKYVVVCVESAASATDENSSFFFTMSMTCGKAVLKNRKIASTPLSRSRRNSTVREVQALATFELALLSGFVFSLGYNSIGRDIEA